MNMSKGAYLIYSIKNNLLDNTNWYYATLGLPTDNGIEDEQFSVTATQFRVKINGEIVVIDDYIKGEPLFTINDALVIDDKILSNVKGTIDTKLGILIANYVLLYKPFGNKIEYINGPITISKIESIIAKLLTDDKKSDNYITIKEYSTFVNNVTFLSSMSKIINVSATYKSMVPPPGIEEYKKKLIKEFKEKYGDDVFKDYTKVAEFEKLLKEYDDEWLKDDPSYGKLTSGKVKNKSRTKLFLTYGAEPGFDRSGVASLVTNSLYKGWPTDPKELSVLYNASRAGSYDRGAETQNGGVAAKVILRASNSIKIIDGDCGTKLGVTRTITKGTINFYRNSYVIEGNKTTKITVENEDNFIGKPVTIRSPIYCKEKNGNFCSVCAGRLANYKTGISLLLINISSELLGISMRSIHGVELKTKPLDLNDHLT